MMLIKESCLYSDSVYIDFIIGKFNKAYDNFSFDIQINSIYLYHWNELIFLKI